MYKRSPTTTDSFEASFQFNKAKKRSKRGFMSNEEGVLIIDNVDADENGGLYTCSVSNPSGEMARRSFELMVVKPPILEEFSFGSNLREGQIAQATCSIRSGDTPIYFSWTKDGSPISTSLKVFYKYWSTIKHISGLLTCQNETFHKIEGGMLWRCLLSFLPWALSHEHNLCFIFCWRHNLLTNIKTYSPNWTYIHTYSMLDHIIMNSGSITYPCTPFLSMFWGTFWVQYLLKSLYPVVFCCLL